MPDLPWWLYLTLFIIWFIVSIPLTMLSFWERFEWPGFSTMDWLTPIRCIWNINSIIHTLIVYVFLIPFFIMDDIYHRRFPRPDPDIEKKEKQMAWEKTDAGKHFKSVIEGRNND